MLSRITELIMPALLAAVLVSPGAAQKGTAPEGPYRYPANYHRDTFTGEVVGTEGSRKLSLEYKNGSHVETFTGTIEAPCMARLKAEPHEAKELELSTIPIGTLLTVFYNPHTNEHVGKEENTILAIRFDRWKGKDFTNPQRPLIPCSKPTGHK